ncbi:MAG: sulfur carrier protein ThiS [Methyloligellaceae bacterium]
MRIIVNGERKETAARTLEELCAALGFSDAKIATALNGDFVPQSARNTCRLCDNDRVEIVAPREGG